MHHTASKQIGLPRDVCHTLFLVHTIVQAVETATIPQAIVIAILAISEIACVQEIVLVREHAGTLVQMQEPATAILVSLDPAVKLW